MDVRRGVTMGGLFEVPESSNQSSQNEGIRLSAKEKQFLGQQAMTQVDKFKGKEDDQMKRFSQGLKNYEDRPRQVRRKNYYKDDDGVDEEKKQVYARLAGRPKSNPKHPQNQQEGGITRKFFAMLGCCTDRF